MSAVQALVTGTAGRVSLREALATTRSASTPVPAEDVLLEAARDRVLAQTIHAVEDLVPFACSAMDGYAVRSADTIDAHWDDPNPRVLWDGGKPIGESSCVSCGHCVTVCPCNALMEKSMLGEAGYLSGLPKPALSGMIDIIKGIEPDMGYSAIPKVSKAESAMRETRTRKTKTVCTYCGVGCSFDVWTRTGPS
jgi:ferredoxin